MEKNKTVKRAFIASLPVLAGYMVLGIGFGIMMRDKGFGVLWTAAMSLSIFSGTLQYVGVGLLAAPATMIQTAITSLIVNARYMFYSISMVKKYKGTGKYKPFLIFGLTDETYTILSGETPKDANENKYRFLVTTFNHIYWIIGGITGNLLGQIIPFSTRGIDFSMTAIFIASFTEEWIKKNNRKGAIIGVVTTLVCLLLFGEKWFLIPSMLIMTLLLSIKPKREAAK